MAKPKKSRLDEDVEIDETPAELPEPEPAPAAAPEWTPPANCIVSDETTYKIRVDGQLYRHVGEAPDGRWVYELDR